MHDGVLHRPVGITKSEAIRRHANRRARERYGMVETVAEALQIEVRRILRKALKRVRRKEGPYDRDRFAEMVENGVVVEAQYPNGRIRARVNVRGQTVRVVFCTAARRVVTWLPRYVDEGRW